MTVQDYLMPRRSDPYKEWEVRTSGSAYQFRDPVETLNPTLTLVRGGTYKFTVSTSAHPFWIKTEQIIGTASAYNNGVTGNGAVRATINGVATNGVLTFVVPANAPNRLFYISQNGATYTGIINIVDGSVGLPPQNISFSSIQEEYGGENPISLNEYYSGGPYVPTGVSGFRGVVPSSGPISTEDLSKIELIKIIGRQWTPSFALTNAMGALNNAGQFFFTSRGYDTILQTNLMPSACFTADGKELWSSKLKFIFGAGIAYNNSTFALNSGNFVIGGGYSATSGSTKPGAFIVSIRNDSLSLSNKKFHNTSHDLSPEHVHWVKDTNEQFFYMIARLAATNSFMVTKIAGPIETMSPSSIVWAKRCQFGITNSQRSGTIINSISSFLYVPAKNQIFASFDTNNPVATGVENNGAWEVVGIDCNDGRIVKYGNYYRTSDTGERTTKYIRGVVTDSDSQGNIIGNFVDYRPGSTSNVSESQYGLKFSNQVVGNASDQYSRDYILEAGRDTNSYAMNMTSFYYNKAWETQLQPAKSILINEEQPNFYPIGTGGSSSGYQHPNTKGDVINLWTQRMTPLNDDNTLPSLTNGRTIVLNGCNSIPVLDNTWPFSQNTGLYSWYISDGDYSITNQNLDLYNYSSVFQQPNNKRRIGFVAKTQNSSGTGQPQFIMTILPKFRQINYNIPTTFYQRLGELPRWPDYEQRPAVMGYGKLQYGPTSRYNYWWTFSVRQQNYYFNDWTVTDLPSNQFVFDTSPQANDWVGWSTGQGNPITKTSFYPTTTYETVASAQTPFYATIATDQQQLNLRSWAIANAWNEINPVIIIINNSAVIWSDNTSIPALTIDGSWPNGITIINQGAIIGKGGRGYGPNGNATAGGPAISLGTNVTIHQEYRSDLNFYPMIAGGGGGGGGGVGNLFKSTIYGIGGGGAGGGEYGGLSLSVTSGVAPRAQGTDGNGGRVVSSTLGAGANFGISVGSAYEGTIGAADGGAGGRGQFNSQGGSGYALLNGDNGGNADGAGGGGYGANGGSGQTFGGAAGKAIQTNGYTVTFVQNVVGNPTIRVYGAVS